MSNLVKLVWNYEGTGELLKTDEGVIAFCQSLAEDALSRCGDGYEISPVFLQKERFNITIRAVTDEARADNLKNNTLLKAIGLA